jgi:hypothetical protein
MVYMNAANDLDDYSELNINQMEQVQANPNVRVVVQWKRAARFAPQGSWTGTRRYLIQYDADTQQINSRLLEDLGQGVDMGSAETLREFVRWARANFLLTATRWSSGITARAGARVPRFRGAPSRLMTNWVRISKSGNCRRLFVPPLLIR